MEMIFALIVSSAAGAIGGRVGELFSFTVAFAASTIASVFGYYYGVKWNREYFC